MPPGFGPASGSAWAVGGLSVHWPILRRLLRRPLRTVCVDDRRAWRGVELIAGALHVAEQIDRLAESPRVGLMLPTSGAFPAAALGAWSTGRTVVPLNYLLKRDELQYVVDHSGIDLILTAGPMLEFLGYEPRVGSILRLEELDYRRLPEPRIPARAPDEELGVLLYTSGTSGKPKGVMLTHANIRANIEQSMACAKFSHEDTFLGVLPQFHSFGFTVLTMLPLTIGAGVIYTARFSPTGILKLLEEHRPSVFVGIPSMFGALLRAKSATPEHFASLRYLVSGGEPLPDAVAEGFEDRFGRVICEGYGLTETSPVTNICLPEHYAPHSVGRPVARLEQRIVDIETGKPLPPGQEGEVRFRGPNVMRGYYKMPEETAESFDDEGFFRTGDMGREDGAGRLYITGRIKEMIIVGGENVFPREIEEVLNRHESVSASGAIGVADDVRGEQPWAFVELAEDQSFDESALRSWCREHLAGYKIPREIRVVEELPRGPTGKILRRELHDLIDNDEDETRDENDDGDAAENAAENGANGEDG